MAGLKNKYRKFWKGLRGWDVITLMKTWADKKWWNRVRGSLPRGYVWEGLKATRKNKRRKAIGGIIIRINKRKNNEERNKNRIGKKDNDGKGENQEREMENYRSIRRKE